MPCGEQATHILVPARAEDGAIALFYVEPGGEGVTLSPQITSDVATIFI